MDLEFIGKGRVKINMNEYIKEFTDVYARDRLKKRKTRGTHDLFNIDNKSLNLDKQNSDMFYHIVAELLFLAK